MLLASYRWFLRIDFLVTLFLTLLAWYPSSLKIITIYLLWRSQFLPVLRAHGLIGFVDGSNVCPDESVVSSENLNLNEINPLFSSWVQQDQVVLCLINATLSEGVLAHVVGLQTSRAVWLALDRRFASLSRSHIIQLKSQPQTIKK
ncbi:hypothetical protein MRB53_026678 [Persea americana]|uniref:Uncharacterized protein n=1 Tax=Persea americana TaxID=3435 RepID=A0ACC2LIP8_PERAE|nr:hypothetical protein MRB53_026678 [Persea americana]